MKIEGYSPEEYAALWGCDSSYDPPGHIGDGALFYNFGSKINIRTKEYLQKFIKAIEFRITLAQCPNDKKDLAKLLKYVKSLKPVKE